MVRTIIIAAIRVLAVCVISVQEPVKLCVPHSLSKSCIEMQHEMPETWECIIARDNLECARKMQQGVADVTNMDAWSLYLAGKYFDGVPVAAEVLHGKTNLDEVVVIVNKTSKLNTPRDLRGQKACLGPRGDPFGWELPIAYLLFSRVLPCHHEDSRLKAIGDFFASGSCAAGEWSADQFVDYMLKKRFPNLCSTCNDTISCSQFGDYAGHEGSIHCLMDQSGDVAFTKLSAISEVLRNDPSINSTLKYICPDGPPLPLEPEGPFCSWASMPPNAYVLSSKNSDVGHHRLYKAFQETEKKYERDFLKPVWYYEVYMTTDEVEKVQRLPSGKSNYVDYLGRFILGMEGPCASTEPIAVLCTTSDQERAKCQDWAKAAHSQGLTPPLGCAQYASKAACMKAAKRKRVNLVLLDPGDMYIAGKYCDMQPVSAEVIGSVGTDHYAIAVVKARSNVSCLADLRGLKSCHSGMGTAAGWIMPIHALLKGGLLSDVPCDKSLAVAKFFNASCVPGANETQYNPRKAQAAKLCQLCEGDDCGAHRCERDAGERYRGDLGALRCLAEGKGDVAFLSHTAIDEYLKHQGTPLWTKNLKLHDLKLICQTGGTAPTDQYQRCNLGKIPARYMMTLGSITTEQLYKLAALMADSSEFFGQEGEMFRLFDDYESSASDLIFSDVATSLQASVFSTDYVLGDAFKEAAVLSDPRKCQPF